MDAEKKKVELKGDDGKARTDVDGNTLYEHEWGNCPEAPTHFHTNFVQLEPKVVEGAAADAKPKEDWLKACPQHW
jgi:hypothetical protein